VQLLQALQMQQLLQAASQAPGLRQAALLPAITPHCCT
jgi:hypothetical protein